MLGAEFGYFRFIVMYCRLPDLLKCGLLISLSSKLIFQRLDLCIAFSILFDHLREFLHQFRLLSIINGVINVRISLNELKRYLDGRKSENSSVLLVEGR